MGESGGSWKVAGAIACLAAVPRMIRPDLVEYKLDEASVVLNARAIVQDHILPLHGQASSVAGLFHSPLLYYIVAPLLAIQPDPRAAVLGIGLVNALAVGLSYVVVERAFNARIALISALLFASGSWAIIFSRKIWSIDLLAPLSVVALWGLLRAIDSRTRSPGLGRTWVALAAMAGLNYSSWPLIALATLVQLTVPRTRQGRALIWSLLGASVFVPPLILLAPSLVELTTRPGTHLGGAPIDLTPFSFVVQLADPTGFLVLGGPSGALDRQLVGARMLQPVLHALLFLGAGIGLVRAIEPIVAAKRAPAIVDLSRGSFSRSANPPPRAPLAWTPEALVLLWWLVPAIAASYRVVPVYVHHFADTLPAQFILIGVGTYYVAWFLGAVVARLAPRARLAANLPIVAGGTIAVIAAIVQLGSFALYLPFVEAHPLDTFFGVPLEYDLRAIDQARSVADGGLVIALGTGEDTVGVHEAPTVLASLTDQSLVQFADADRTLVFPASGQAVYLLRRSPDDHLDDALAPWREPGGPLSPRSVDLGGVYQEVRVQAPGAWLPSDWHHLEVPLEDHGLIVGYAAPRQIEPGKPTEIDVAWRVGEPAPNPLDQSVFVHVVDDQGRSAVGQDFAPMPSSRWQPGETMINRFTVTPPSDLSPGRYWIDFGRYRRPDIQPVRVAATGTPGPTSIRFGPVAVPPPRQDVPGLTPSDALFGRAIRLVGWKAEATGVSLDVTLVWQAEKAPRTRYTVFTHLLASNGSIVTQNDSEPRSGQFPTTTWKQGDRIVDLHALPLKEAQPGQYRLEVGIYSATSGKRLPVGRGDAYVVGPITIAGPSTASSAHPPTPGAKPPSSKRRGNGPSGSGNRRASPSTSTPRAASGR